jgi:hypothetical protein
MCATGPAGADSSGPPGTHEPAARPDHPHGPVPHLQIGFPGPRPSASRAGKDGSRGGIWSAARRPPGPISGTPVALGWDERPRVPRVVRCCWPALNCPGGACVRSDQRRVCRWVHTASALCGTNGQSIHGEVLAGISPGTGRDSKCGCGQSSSASSSWSSSSRSGWTTGAARTAQAAALTFLAPRKDGPGTSTPMTVSTGCRSLANAGSRLGHRAAKRLFARIDWSGVTSPVSNPAAAGVAGPLRAEFRCTQPLGTPSRRCGRRRSARPCCCRGEACQPPTPPAWAGACPPAQRRVGQHQRGPRSRRCRPKPAPLTVRRRCRQSPTSKLR